MFVLGQTRVLGTRSDYVLLGKEQILVTCRVGCLIMIWIHDAEVAFIERSIGCYSYAIYDQRVKDSIDACSA